MQKFIARFLTPLLEKTGNEELANAREIDLGEKLVQFKEQKFKKASKFINQSKAYLSGIPIRIFESENISYLLSNS